MSELNQMCVDALARDPAGPVIEFEGKWFTWGDLHQEAEKVKALLAQTGAGADAPVIFIPRNRPSSIATLFALLAQGRTIRMIYAFQSPTGIARDIQKLKAPVVIAGDQEFSPEVIEVLKADGIAGIAISEMDAKPVAGAEHARPDFAAEASLEPQISILTSGTTGPPKQFPITYDMILKLVAGGLTQSTDAKDFSKEPPFLLYMPLGNISGIYTTVPTLIRGQRVVLLDRFKLDLWHDYVVRYRPAAGGLPPAGVQMVLDANIPAADLSSIKYVGTGAAPLDPTVQKAFEERYNIPILLSYGATEFGGPVTAMSYDLYTQFGSAKFGTVGRPIGGAQLRVINPETEEVLPPNQEGILEVVSPRIGDHWIRTSDIAVIDEDGFLFHRGRADGAIMRGGFKILPETIERALQLHPAVSAAGVVGVPDKRLGQVPGAAIQIKPDMAQPSTEELEAHLRANVLATHIPVHWRFVDALPKTLSFKVDRPAVGRLFEDDAAN